MKIYVVKYNPFLFKKNISKLEDLLVSTVQINEIYSEKYGLQIIANNKVHQIESQFDTKMEMKNYNGFDLLLDRTKYTKSDVISQLPINYILSKTWHFEYKPNKQSNLALIVKCIKEEKEEKEEKEKKQEKQDEGECKVFDLIPIDLYFECDDNQDFNHKFFQEEFNMLLSQLN